MTLRPETARSLAFIRLLLAKGQEESRLAPPYCYDSLGRLHDATEMFLALAVQEHHKSIPRDFLKYWDELEPVLRRPLQYRAQAARFNKARVGWKHFGAEPAVSEIETARATVEGLLTDECLPLFGVELEAVSLASFVRPSEAQVLVQAAERAWALADEEGAFADLVAAFHVMLEDYETRKLTSHKRSVFGPQHNLTSLSAFFQGIPFGKEHDFVDAVIETLQAHDLNIRIVGFGLDFRRYGKFNALTPRLKRMSGGQRQTSEPVRPQPRTNEDFNFCRDFVISSAIQLTEFDYDAATPAHGGHALRIRRGPSAGIVEPLPADVMKADDDPTHEQA